MNPSLELWEHPEAREIYMVAGWRQWADAGSISSELPLRLIRQLDARQIGRIKSDGLYLFQVPGTHHLFRPEIKLKDGHRESLELRKNEIFYAGNADKGLVIVLGDEPQLNVEAYADAFFDIARELGVKRVAALGGVYGAVPYDKDRQVTCIYSLPRMKDELSRYAVQFSNYEGGVTIGTFLADRAEQLGIEYFVLYAFVPLYDLSQLSAVLRSIMIETDYKAWYDLAERLNFMWKLGLDLAELETESRELNASVQAQIAGLEEKMPQLGIEEYIQKLTENFVETQFSPLDDVWQSGLDDILDNLD